MPKNTMVVTGHRPPKIGGYQNETAIRRLARSMNELLVKVQPDEGMSGFALGVDQIFAGECIKLGVPLIAAIPFRDQFQRWPSSSQDHYHWLLSKAAKIIYVDKLADFPSLATSSYAKVLNARNIYMVDHGTSAAVYWNHEPGGGTWNCLQYINKCILDPNHIMKEAHIHNTNTVISTSKKENDYLSGGSHGVS